MKLDPARAIRSAIFRARPRTWGAAEEYPDCTLKLVRARRPESSLRPGGFGRERLEASKRLLVDAYDNGQLAMNVGHRRIARTFSPLIAPVEGIFTRATLLQARKLSHQKVAVCIIQRHTIGHDFNLVTVKHGQ